MIGWEAEWSGELAGGLILLGAAALALALDSAWQRHKRRREPIEPVDQRTMARLRAYRDAHPEQES